THTSYVFFFQAEDGIRDRNVTGVQTCALPICSLRNSFRASLQYSYVLRLARKLFRREPAISVFDWLFTPTHTSSPHFSTYVGSRSEERRVGIAAITRYARPSHDIEAHVKEEG